MEMLAKLRDAGSMFWSCLDERERRLLLLGCAYLVASGLVVLEGRRREGERERLRELVREVIADARS